MARERPSSQLDTESMEIDRSALAGVVGGEEGVELGKGQWHMAIGTAVGLGGYLLDRFERKNIAAEASRLAGEATQMLKKLGGRVP